MTSATSQKLCIVQPNLGEASETFLRAHAERLPADVTVVHNGTRFLPKIGKSTVLSQSLGNRAWRKAQRFVLGRDWNWEVTSAYLRAFTSADAVLAEYGTTAVAVNEACQIADIPLISHFHGFDASKHDVLREQEEGYRKLFASTSAIVAVSEAMKRKLVSLGAPAEKVHVNPCGVDCEQFTPTKPAHAPPVFVAVGRFVEKKAPYLTILAFAEVYKEEPQARLRMIGDGPLFGPCRDIVRALRMQEAVTLLGVQPHDVVARELHGARAFVQHSVEASDGDCEGTPVGVLEASAKALPVVSTRHGGIPDVIVHGETGLLVDERDVAGMAAHMLRLVREPQLAAELGTAGRNRIVSNYTMDHSIGRLWSVISSCIKGHQQASNAARRSIEAALAQS